MNLQGVVTPDVLTQGAASLAQGYVLLALQAAHAAKPRMLQTSAWRLSSPSHTPGVYIGLHSTPTQRSHHSKFRKSLIIGTRQSKNKWDNGIIPNPIYFFTSIRVFFSNMTT